MISSALLALRRGDISFDDFARVHGSWVRSRVESFLARATVHGATRDDFVQEALLETWRAVGVWDEARGVAIESWVSTRIAGALSSFRRRLDTRSKYRPTFVPFFEEDAHARALGGFERIELREAARWVAERAARDSRRNVRELATAAGMVVTAAGLGISLRGAAAKVARDGALGVDDPESATRKLQGAARLATRLLSERSDRESCHG